jgi:hypothetical protein
MCTVWLLGEGDVAGAEVAETKFYVLMGCGFEGCPIIAGDCGLFSSYLVSWCQVVRSHLNRKVQCYHFLLPSLFNLSTGRGMTKHEIGIT